MPARPLPIRSNRKMRLRTKTLIAVIGYVAMMGFTYGHVYREEYAVQQESFPHLSPAMWGSSAAFSAGLPAIYWPLFWPGHIAKNLMMGNDI